MLRSFTHRLVTFLRARWWVVVPVCLVAGLGLFILFSPLLFYHFGCRHCYAVGYMDRIADEVATYHESHGRFPIGYTELRENSPDSGLPRMRHGDTWSLVSAAEEKRFLILYRLVLEQNPTSETLHLALLRNPAISDEERLGRSEMAVGYELPQSGHDPKRIFEWSLNHWRYKAHASP